MDGRAAEWVGGVHSDVDAVLRVGAGVMSTIQCASSRLGDLIYVL